MWIVIRYEDLAKQPVPQFKKLFRKLDLNWSKRLEDELRELTGEDKPSESDDPGFKARNSKAMREVWMNRLDMEQIETIRRETEPVLETLL